MNENTEYLFSKLKEYLRDVEVLNQIEGILEWDLKTYMPPLGISNRMNQISLLSRLSHELFTSEKIGELLKKLSSAEDLTDIQKRNVYLWNKYYNQEINVPKELVEKLSKQQSKTEDLWKTAKKKSDFKLIQNDLELLIELVKQKSEKMNPDIHPYNVLLDIYEPNMTYQQIDKFFSQLKPNLSKILNKIINSQSKRPFSDSVIKFYLPISEQEKISNFLMEFLRLDNNRTRIDKTEHPFSTGHIYDVRITTKYDENEPFNNFYSILHEGGHAIYDLNLPKDWEYLAIGHACGLGVHESQSRFFENVIGRSKEFLYYSLGELKKIIPKFDAISLEQLYQAVNYVQPSKIRIHADELTYNFHIILRYEIEKEIFDEKVSINELPQLWNEKMQEYLYQKIENDREGILQDIHWYEGAFGYFPDYILGNIYDGQILAAINKLIQNWKEELKQGNIDKILEWLKINIHSKGKYYDPIELIEKSVNSKIDIGFFIKYLEDKYNEIY